MEEHVAELKASLDNLQQTQTPKLMEMIEKQNKQREDLQARVETTA